MFVIIVENLPTARPFVGWTDRNGAVRTDGVCVAEGVDCIPLIISENVPQGRPFLNRIVGPDPSDAPILNYDDGTPLRRPPFTLP